MGSTIMGRKVVVTAFIAAASVVAHAQAPVIAQGGVLNAANGISPVTPGSLISIYGTNLAGGLSQANTVPLSNTLNNVSVTINNIPAPLDFVSQTQINAQVPWTLPASGSASVVVTNNGQVSAAQSVSLGQFSPGIFADGTIGIVINNADGTLAAAPGAIPGLNTHAASVTDPLGVQIWCTGLGAVSPTVASGTIPASGTISYASTTPVIMVGGKAATVLFAGLQPNFPGVNQINILLAPDTPKGNAVPVQIVVGGITTTNTITMAVQ
jgi:uncharacterized protein (TIGR03437 family)